MRSSRRSPCPVACTLDLIGDRWTLLVLRDLACGRTQFKAFLASPEKIATNILADRLQRMLKHGLIERTPSEAYQLTEKGRSLLPVLRSIADWGLANIPGTEARMKVVAG